ncbi:MAG: ABC transporter ATP-binding protein [Chloroflexi bacterium]|nr:ABC transporter ATP-binding protein [Chloroflexota bacterium]
MHACGGSVDRFRESETVLHVQDLSITYKTRKGAMPVVRNLSFAIRRGESLGLVGESGCGKSTAALACMAYLAPNAFVPNGRILFEGENLLEKNEPHLQHIRGNRIAMVYQDPMATLNPVLTIKEQMLEVLTTHQLMLEKQAHAWCLEMLRKVNMPDPEEVLERYPHQISGGQQQRIVIAMALLCNPSLLIMDEPTTALDVTIAATVLDLIQALRQEFNSAILYISHNLGVVARVCDRVAVMYAGELAELAPVNDLFLQPLHPYTKSLLRCVPTLQAGKDMLQLSPIPGQVPMLDDLPAGCIFEPRCGYSDNARCREARPEFENAYTQRMVRCFRWQESFHGAPRSIEEEAEAAQPEMVRALNSRDTLLKLSHLRTDYVQKAGWLKKLVTRQGDRRVKAVEDVSFDLRPGSIIGVVGESGCGKTSLAKTVAGLVAPSGGTIEFLGLDVTRVVEKRDPGVLRELQMVFQNPDSTLNPTQTVRQIIARPLHVCKTVPASEIDQEVRRLLKAVKLNEHYLERRPHQLSGGEKQRVAIARAFASRPQLVICDEPVSSLDVSVQSSVLNTLLKIQELYGTSLIFISHDLSVVRYLCDYILVMYLGKVVEFGPSDKIFQPPYHPYTEALLSAVPVPDPTAQQQRIRLHGPMPSVLNPPSGCRFHTRCPRKAGKELCEKCEPSPQDAGDGLVIYCHMPVETLEQVKPVTHE